MAELKPHVWDMIFRSTNVHPYYIMVPPLKRQSAGIYVLHRLCHMLNLAGYPAFLVIEREWLGICGYPANPANTSWLTPHLTTEMAEQHFAEGKTPVVIYPDAVKGRPLKSGVTAIYLLNYLGLLGGESTFSDDVLYFSYSKKIARTSPAPDRVLFLPVSDPNFFVPPAPGGTRKGICYYASKYKHFHRMEVGPEVDGAIEITRDLPDSQTKQDLKHLFQASEFFYCYENSALAIEAALCGCPVAFIPNQYLAEAIAEDELGNDGFAWGLAPEQLAKAKRDVHLFRERYIASMNAFEKQFSEFIEFTQARAKITPYRECIDLSKTLVTFGYEISVPLQKVLALKALEILYRTRGTKALIRRLVKNRLVAWGIWDLLKAGGSKSPTA